MHSEKKFVVSVTEKNYGYAFVEAGSKEEAEAKALEIYDDGNFFWNNTELSELVVREDAINDN